MARTVSHQMPERALWRHQHCCGEYGAEAAELVHTRISLSEPKRPRDIEEGCEKEPLLLRLPTEIRWEISSYLACPEKTLTICSMKNQRRLVALPTRKCDVVGDGTRAHKQEKRNKLEDFLAAKLTGQSQVRWLLSVMASSLWRKSIDSWMSLHPHMLMLRR